MLTLNVQARETKDKPDTIRKGGDIPAVFYGKKEASTPIKMSEKDFMKIWKEAGESTVVTLKTPEGEKESLIHDVDIDPLSGKPRHADFYVFEKGHEVEVELPIEYEGTSRAIKELGATLVKVTHELRITAMPKNLPKSIVIDISTLNEIGDQVAAEDIVLPEGVSLVGKPDEVIALIAAAREEKEEEAPAMDLSEIEVEKKGKEDEEGEAGTEGSAPEAEKEA